MQITQALAEFIARSRSVPLPAEVMHKTKEVLIDSIACTLGGHSLALGRAVTAYARLAGAGAPEATVLGTPDRVPAAVATLVNGELMNALDLDEVLLNWGHQVPYVIPGALAVAERDGISGGDLLRAIAVGYEIASRISAALAGSVYIDGRPPKLEAKTIPVYGFQGNTFGSAAAVGMLLDLDQERMAHALGLAGHMAPVPTSSRWGSALHTPMSKYAVAGWISQAGLTAAQLAACGFTGDTEVLEGPNGFWKMVGSPRWAGDKILAGLGTDWQILRSSFKLYPCCRFFHHGMDLIDSLIRQNAIEPDRIDKVTVRLLSRAAESAVFTQVSPSDEIDAQFSGPYVMAATAYGLQRFPDLLSAKTMQHPGVARLASKVKLEAEPRLTERRYERFGNEAVGPLADTPTSVEIAIGNQRFEAYTETCLGDPWESDKRLSKDELGGKFLSCAQTVLSGQKAESALSLLWQSDSLPDVRQLAAALASEAGTTVPKTRHTN